MRNFIILLILFLTLNSYGQNGNPIRDIRYYNSLEWKNANSFAVYIDCTYTLPLERKIVNNKCVNRTYILPYRYIYPYSGYRYYNPYGCDMGYNRVYYTPLIIGKHNHHKHHR